MTESEIKEFCYKLAQQGICQGNCEEHRGEVKVAHTSGWGGYFSYCEEAVAEDIRRGLTVEVCDVYYKEAE